MPRGEYTWIAEDLGDAGLVRVATEEPFKGARIVKSWGHVAEHGYINGMSPEKKRRSPSIDGYWRLLVTRTIVC